MSPLNAVIVCSGLGGSGVSLKSVFPPGDVSAPETSEKSSGSKGFRGVVKDGLRNGVAGFAVAASANELDRFSND